MIESESGALQDASMTDATRRFLFIFLPIAAALAVIGGYWIRGHAPYERDRNLAKEHPLRFPKVNSAAEAMVQLDTCLQQYGLVHDDEFPVDLEPVGPEGSKCTYAGLTDIASKLKYRFVYTPSAEDAKGKARGFLLYAYPLFTWNGQMAPEGTAAEYFASENGVVLVRREFGTAREHIEPLVGLPKTLQVLSAKFSSDSHLPVDQSGILTALGPEASPGFSSVPKGYAGLWTAADNGAVAVWTNLSEGYLYSYRRESGSAPAHFTLVARPARIGISGFDAPVPRVRKYFLNESGGIRATFLDREATAEDPEISSCERTAEDCEPLWISPSASGAR
ncbi:MAG TPA: hypothetical protein VEI73_14045 [Candidatus Acidoferrum sp.]|nr:hypothetical protein [Candidatus Acidoferrum sp.]